MNAKLLKGIFMGELDEIWDSETCVIIISKEYLCGILGIIILFLMCSCSQQYIPLIHSGC